MQKRPWTIKELHEAHQLDLMACNNDFERGMVLAINGPHIIDVAKRITQKRKLTKTEASIAKQYGNPVWLDAY